MATKYKRPGHEDEKFDWEVPGRSVKSTRRRLVFINLALCAACLALLLFHFMGQNATERWLPIRDGDGVIVEKTEAADDDGEVAYVLSVRVTVPAVNEEEVDFLQGDPEDIAKRSGQLELGDKVATDARSFELVNEGDIVSVDYQIDMQRKRIMIRRLHQVD